MDASVHIEAGQTDALQRLVRYMVRCPFSLERILKIGENGQVIYHAEHADARAFPLPGRLDGQGAFQRNFQIFDPLDFLAEVTQHIPDPGQHLILCYGEYSHKKRGLRAKVKGDEAQAPPVPVPEPDGDFRKQCRQRWAAFIKQVYETDPLICPQCGGTMRIIAFIERRQEEVIRKILEHCGLWEENRGPPETAPPIRPGDWTYEPDPEFNPVVEAFADF
ncbi:MAG: transposase [Verrucomicrobia bacterium]|nr:transposase [Verrucomicrobiota bacterium]